jgi:hypothetical protein
MKGSFISGSVLLVWTFMSLADVTKGEFKAAPRGDQPPALDQSRPEQPKKRKNYPFRGEVYVADQEAKLLLLKGKSKNRPIKVTAETKILREGRPVTLKDVIIGETVSGSVVRGSDGVEQAITIHCKGIDPKLAGK